ncbi:MAG TPA: hypothetical protein VHW23_47120 [Kofleriaceae bacterium]|jgi:hypothetical protein|nr:hypothetical protein [Kofleriaceae bacterium]
MASSIETFEQAKQLDTAALRALLVTDRPEQRVWAMWALALRHQGVPEMIQRTAVEPDPGVRRTLAVMLASHGETDLLVALARHDPALVVRASAMQLVTRLAGSGLIDRAVVLEAAQREPEIRAAILAGIDARAPEFLVAIAMEVLQHGAPELQLDAFEALIRAGAPPAMRRALAWLGAASGPLAVEACRRWARAEAPEAVVRVLTPAPAAMRSVALEALTGASWPVVEPLVADDSALLIRAVAVGFAVPAHLLAHRVLELDGWHVPLIAALVRRLRALRVPSPELVPLLPRLHAYCERQDQRKRAAANEAWHTFEHRRRAALSDGSGSDGTARTSVREELGCDEERWESWTLRFEVDRLSGKRGSDVPPLR